MAAVSRCMALTNIQLTNYLDTRNTHTKLINNYTISQTA
jgi:hypothetical protein